MSNLWHDIPPGPHVPEQVTAVIEIPSGSRNKYELDKITGLLKLDRVLYSAVQYPGDYGFIPGTLAEDGCLITVRPVGVLMMKDKGDPDEKILAVPSEDPYHQEYFDIADLPQHYLKEVEHFFSVYKDLEGKRVEIDGWRQSTVAMATIEDCIKRYDEKYPR
jgi:inorganic pyrophosphatase